MPVMMDWLIEGEVIYQHWWGTSTMEDIRYVDRRTIDMYNEYPERPLIHTIANGLKQEKTETSIPAARRAYTVLDHRQTGWVLIVLSNKFLVFFINIILQLNAKTRFRIQNSNEDSIAFLKEVDPALNWDKADWSIIESFENANNG